MGLPSPTPVKKNDVQYADHSQIILTEPYNSGFIFMIFEANTNSPTPDDVTVIARKQKESTLFPPPDPGREGPRGLLSSICRGPISFFPSLSY